MIGTYGPEVIRAHIKRIRSQNKYLLKLLASDTKTIAIEVSPSGTPPMDYNGIGPPPLPVVDYVTVPVTDEDREKWQQELQRLESKERYSIAELKEMLKDLKTEALLKRAGKRITFTCGICEKKIGRDVWGRPRSWGIPPEKYLCIKHGSICHDCIVRSKHTLTIVKCSGCKATVLHCEYDDDRREWVKL